MLTIMDGRYQNEVKQESCYYVCFNIITIFMTVDDVSIIIESCIGLTLTALKMKTQWQLLARFPTNKKQCNVSIM